LKALHKEARSIHITATIAQIEIEPTINGGSTGVNRGFRQLDSLKTIVAPDCNDEELGRSIRAAWELCE